MSFYPINPDTAVESFLLISSDVQQTNLGQTYNLSQLVPLNYRKVMDAIINPDYGLAVTPLREFYYIYSDAIKAQSISDEFTNNYQGSTLATAFAELFNYYDKNLCQNEFFVGAGVVTEIKTDLLTNPDYVTGNGNTFFITHKLKVEWFVVPGSTFS
jgi:hypothetical protein